MKPLCALPHWRALHPTSLTHRFLLPQDIMFPDQARSRRRRSEGALTPSPGWHEAASSSKRAPKPLATGRTSSHLRARASSRGTPHVPGKRNERSSPQPGNQGNQAAEARRGGDGMRVYPPNGPVEAKEANKRHRKREPRAVVQKLAKAVGAAPSEASHPRRKKRQEPHVPRGGVPLSAETCQACGNTYLADSVFCRKCGVKRGAATSEVRSPVAGQQEVRYPNGDVYVGQLRDGLREGEGSCAFADHEVLLCVLTPLALIIWAWNTTGGSVLRVCRTVAERRTMRPWGLHLAPSRPVRWGVAGRRARRDRGAQV